jgi:hypothetical protein
MFVPEERPQNYLKYIHFEENFKPQMGDTVCRIVSLTFL